METPSAERLVELQPVVLSIYDAYFKAKDDKNITGEEFAILMGGIIGVVAAENEIENGDGEAIKIMISAIRMMLPYANPRLIAQRMRERLSAARRPPAA